MSDLIAVIDIELIQAMPVDERTRIVTPAKLSVTPCAAWPNGAWMQVSGGE